MPSPLSSSSRWTLVVATAAAAAVTGIVVLAASTIVVVVTIRRRRSRPRQPQHTSDTTTSTLPGRRRCDAAGVVAAKGYQQYSSFSSSNGAGGSCCCYESLIGNTPLQLLPNISNLIQRNIYVKMENMNPGGTGKDRAALSLIQQAEASGTLPPPPPSAAAAAAPTVVSSYQQHHYQRQQQEEQAGRLVHNGTTAITTTTPPDTQKQQAHNNSNNNNSNNSNNHPINQQTNQWIINHDRMDASIHRAMQVSRSGGLVIEGTSGSTGISLALLCASHGHGCLIIMPNDQAREKLYTLQTLQAVVLMVPPASITHPDHYVNIARRIADRAKIIWHIPAVFMDQFENVANYQIHYTQTGPEIWHQCAQDISAFVMSCGTGGTIAGVGQYLKEQSNGTCQVILVDPPGSVLYNKIEHGVAYTSQQGEQNLRRHRYDTLAEGIGLDRITTNLAKGLPYIDHAIRVQDQEAIYMAHWILQLEGLWIGSSTAMNLVGAIQTALSLPEQSTIVTIMCDHGHRHLTRFWDRSFCIGRGLSWPPDYYYDNNRKDVDNNDGNDRDAAAKERLLLLPECLRDYLNQRS